MHKLYQRAKILFGYPCRKACLLLLVVLCYPDPAHAQQSSTEGARIGTVATQYSNHGARHSTGYEGARIGSVPETMRGHIGGMREKTTGMMPGIPEGKTGRKSPFMTGEPVPSPTDFGDEGGAGSQGGTPGLQKGSKHRHHEDPLHREQRRQNQFSGSKRGQAMDSGSSNDNGGDAKGGSNSDSGGNASVTANDHNSGGNAGGGAADKGSSHSTIRHTLGSMWNAIEKATGGDSSFHSRPHSNGWTGVRGTPNPEGDSGGGRPAGAVNTGRLVDAPRNRHHPRVPAAALNRGSQVDAPHRHSGGQVRSLPTQQGITDPGGR